MRLIAAECVSATPVMATGAALLKLMWPMWPRLNDQPQRH